MNFKLMKVLDLFDINMYYRMKQILDLFLSYINKLSLKMPYSHSERFLPFITNLSPDVRTFLSIILTNDVLLCMLISLLGWFCYQRI